MLRLIGNKGTEKTKELMNEAYQNNGLFVCQNASHMIEKANAYGFNHLNIISYRDFIDDIQQYGLVISDVSLKGYKDPEERPIYIDNLEGLIQYICFNKFKGYTIDL